MPTSNFTDLNAGEVAEGPFTLPEIQGSAIMATA
jgi:hypothetical protein